MKPGVQVTLGFVVAAALLWVAVWLWVNNWIVFAAPVGALALGAAWVGVDNAVIYPAERARRQAEALADGSPPLPQEPPALPPGPESTAAPTPLPGGAGTATTDASSQSDVTVPR